MKQRLQKSRSQMSIKVYTKRGLKENIDTFLSNKTHIVRNREAVIASKVNHNGFIEVLNGGFKCTGKETIEVCLPIEIDLSVKQNQGFSIYFWFITFKPAVNQKPFAPFYIFKKGNTVDEFTPTIGLISNGTTLFIQLTTTKQNKRFFYSNKKIEYNHFYSFAVTFGIDCDEEKTDISIYLDGKLDAQGTILGEPLHNQGNIYLGKPDITTNGFLGTIADVILVPRILKVQEIQTIFEYGLENLSNSKGISLYTMSLFNDLFERYKFANKYALYTGKAMYAVENLNLSNQRMKEMVKNYDIEEKKNDIPPPVIQHNYSEEQMISKMSQFLRNEDNDVLVRKLIESSRFINTVFFLANKGEDNLEVERVLNIFKVINETLHFNIEEEFIINLGTCLNALIVEKKDGKGGKKLKTYYLTLSKFFKNLKRSIVLLEDLQQQEDDEFYKYFINKKKLNRIKSFYSHKKIERHPEEIVTHIDKDKYGFKDCFPEHEKLLLKGQHLKNVIDGDEEETLENYQSAFVLKSIYEKPKHLPGENPEFPIAKIIESSIHESKILENDEEDKDKNDYDPLVVKLVQKFVFDTFDHAFSSTEVNVNLVKEENFGEIIQKSIYDKREKIKKMKEEEELKEKEKERKKEEDDEKIMNTDPKVVERNDYDPVIPENWADGNFEVVINHCYNCHRHETTTKHYEYYFINKFNEIGEAISNVFPNCVIVGNLDEQDYLGNFDVYLRGTGLPGDEKGRYFIYRKFETLRFPTVSDILDKLVALAIMYGNSMNIESAQLDIIKENNEKLPITHDYPGTLSENGEKRRQILIDSKKEKPKIDPDYTKIYCTHWGCNKIYVENENKSKSCCYHPGLWQFGSFNRYWPECWTCCEGKWDSQGCIIGYHSGVLLEKRLSLCLNHGEVNPFSGKPDSVCGTYYTDKSDEGCTYHSGYIKKGTWSCCGDEKEKKGCISGKHVTEQYPHEKTQLNFYPKVIFNPGLQNPKESNEKSRIKVADLISNCDYFKNSKKYPNAKEVALQKKAKIKEEESMKRFCFNFGCEKEYMEKENTPTSCRCHPGKWDHGSSGSTMVKYIAEMNQKQSEDKNFAILWKPHWTCCRRDWNEEGCTISKHHGPLEGDLPKYNKIYKWPDERLKLSFNKITGDRWKEYLAQFMYDEAKVRRICKAEFRGEKIPISQIPTLCDKLRLYLILVQDNPDWTMKYYDVAHQCRTISFFSTDGLCDMEKFIQWWKLSYLEIYNTLYPPKKSDLLK